MRANPGICALLTQLSIASSIFCLILGLLVLTGWLIGIDFLKNPIPHQIPVAPTTATGFALSGVILLLYRNYGPKVNILARFLAAGVCLLGALVLFKYILQGVDIEQWLFSHQLADIEQFAPGRMAPNTAAGFLFAGLALMVLTLGEQQYLRVQIIGSVLTMLGYFTVLGYLYGFPFMYGIAQYTRMALPTGIAFIALGLALLFYRPASGLTAILTESCTAGFVARRLIPAAVIVPFILGAIRVLGQRQGLFEWDFGVTFLVVATTIVMLALIGVTSRSISSLDEERNRLAEQRDNFMAVLIHDLKNPLIGSERVLEHLLAGALDPLTKNQHTAIQLLHKTNHDLLDMIKNLLELYRLDRGKETLCFGPTDILPLLDKTIARFRSLAEAEKKYIRTRFPDKIPSVNADATALEQVIGNLLQNAIKFTPINGIIEVTAEGLEDLVLIKVRDTGKGISAQEQERLFKPFSQGEVGKQFTSGTGLGLYLSYQLVAAHKGHLTCVSHPNEGTTFVISLPAPKQQMLQPAQEADGRYHVQ